MRPPARPLAPRKPSRLAILLCPQVAHGVGSMAKGMTHALDSAAHHVAGTLTGHGAAGSTQAT